MKEKPFHQCTMCEKELLEDNSYYMIEKAFSQNVNTGEKEVIFEYAVCLDCHTKLSTDLSEKSLERIKMYFDLYVDFEKRDEELISRNEKVNVNDWIENCIISKKPVKNLKEFQVAAMCYKDKVMFGNLPFAIGFEAADEMQKLLSKQTKDTLDGLRERISPVKDWDLVPDDKLIFV